MSDKSPPLISVLMSVYNAEKYLSDAINSILNQTHRNFEFIIVEDGSLDKSLEICRKYCKQDARIKLIENRVNLGLTKSLNIALGQCRGKYIARMDADDISLPIRFNRQKKYLDFHPEIALVGSFYHEIDEQGSIQRQNIRFAVEPILVAWKLRFKNPIPHPPIMFRREVLKKLNGYDEAYPYAQDYDFFFRMSKYFKLSNIPEILFLWRVHDNSISSSRRELQKTIAMSISKKNLANLCELQLSKSSHRILWEQAPKNLCELCVLVFSRVRVGFGILFEKKWKNRERWLFIKILFRDSFELLFLSIPTRRQQSV